MKILSKSQVETIDFKSFCNGHNQKTGIGLTDNGIRNNITAYSLYINPLAFFDGHFIIAAGCVVLVAVLEKKLADNGIIGAAAVLSGVLRLSLPIVGLVSILYLISKLGVFI
jgi:hypothetical protein